MTFSMQIVCLIIAPAFLAAGWYILLGRLIKNLGPQYCRLNPLTYAIIFVCGDLASLIIQAVGGSTASAAKTDAKASTGANIMVGGIAVQLVVMSLYTVLLSEFVWSLLADRPVKQFRFRKTKEPVVIPANAISPEVLRKAKIMIGAMVFSTFLIFIRSVYRIIELGKSNSYYRLLFQMLNCILV